MITRKQRNIIIILFFILHIIVYIYLQCNVRKSPQKKSLNRLGSSYLKMKKLLTKLVVCKENITCHMSRTTPSTSQNVSRRELDPWQFTLFHGVEIHVDMVCPPIPYELGPVANDQWIMDLRGLDDMNTLIRPGGIYVPIECIAVQRVAIVIPVYGISQNNRQNIGSFLYYIHPFLIRQQTEYQIFIIRKRNRPYKRGELFNIGFKEAQAYRPDGWDCIIFHDIHIIPVDTRNLYRCSQYPRKLIAEFQHPYRFGGAVAIRPMHYKLVNGFSNNKLCNDEDYIDMYQRISAANLSVEVNVVPIGNYTTFNFTTSFEESSVTEDTPEEIMSGHKDGLSNVSYTVSLLELRPLYTLVEVDELFNQTTKNVNNKYHDVLAANVLKENKQFWKII